MSWKLVAIAAIAVFVGYKVRNCCEEPEVPVLEETWWGAGGLENQDKSIRPFKINVSNEVIQDLKYRLDHHVPFTPPLEGIAQQYGMNTNLLNEIVEFWRTKYDWKQRQEFLNQYPQFLTNIQGLDVHYIHVKPKNVPEGVKVLPLLMLHGWPGSVREFYEIIPLLTTPQKDRDIVFEVIVASLPGYGFSQAAVRPGLGAAHVAVVFKNLMERLGFEKYYVQGGDFGGIALQALAVLFPDKVLGFHSNLCVVWTGTAFLKQIVGAIYPTWFVKPEHVDRVYPLTEKWGELLQETGYLHIQATKPDTIGVAMKDSPVGLAAYILEKFVTASEVSARTREDGGLRKAYKYEDLLDNVMIYWVTGSMPTALRLYAETFGPKNYALGVNRMPVKVPSACARFKHDLYSTDSAIKEVYKNLVQLNDFDGGHFSAFQVPDVLAGDIYVAVRKFEDINNKPKDKQSVLLSSSH